MVQGQKSILISLSKIKTSDCDPIWGVSCTKLYKTSFTRIDFDSVVCFAGAAGSPVSDRPAPADPREHPESLVGEIPHQTQRALTSAVRQQQRQTVQRASDQSDTSHRLRRRQCAQVWWPNMLEYLHSFLHCPQTPLTAAAQLPLKYTARFWCVFSCTSTYLCRLLIPRSIVFHVRLPGVVFWMLQ